jgi:hypothetical protein
MPVVKARNKERRREWMKRRIEILFFQTAYFSGNILLELYYSRWCHTSLLYSAHISVFYQCVGFVSASDDKYIVANAAVNGIMFYGYVCRNNPFVVFTRKFMISSEHV